MLAHTECNCFSIPHLFSPVPPALKLPFLITDQDGIRMGIGMSPEYSEFCFQMILEQSFMKRWFLFQLVQTKKVENLNFGFFSIFSYFPSILSSHVISVGLEMKCSSALKAQDWRESCFSPGFATGVLHDCMQGI